MFMSEKQIAGVKELETLKPGDFMYQRFVHGIRVYRVRKITPKCIMLDAAKGDNPISEKILPVLRDKPPYYSTYRLTKDYYLSSRNMTTQYVEWSVDPCAFINHMMVAADNLRREVAMADALLNALRKIKSERE